MCLSQCREADEISPDNGLGITGVTIPPSFEVAAGGQLAIEGKGFAEGDALQMKSVADANEYTALASLVTDSSVAFPVPESMVTGIYQLTVVRGSNQLALGRVLINLIADVNLPDRAGMTVKGIVYDSGQGVAGVVVSDGITVTTTDEEGRYYLPSQKETGFVFISIPGNYEVANEGNAPQFFHRLSPGTTSVERKDFSLIPVNNDQHVVIPMADWHLANRNNDLDQFNNNVLPDVNATIDRYAAEGTKVYILTLGDMTWETYCYNCAGPLCHQPHLYSHIPHHPIPHSAPCPG